MTEILQHITIGGTADQVFDALTTRDGLVGWWTDDVDAAPTVGSTARFGFYGGQVYFDMKIVELEPGRRIVWECTGGPPDWVGTHVTWDLSRDDEGGTTVDFTHGAFDGLDGAFAMVNTTWGGLMHRLKGYVEGAAPGPYFTTPT